MNFVSISSLLLSARLAAAEMPTALPDLRIERLRSDFMSYLDLASESPKRSVETIPQPIDY